MKGIVFTEFLDMVEQEFGYTLVDQIITESDLPSNGIYTAIGTYDFSEMIQLLTGLHKHTKIPVPTLLNSFGQYLFGTFIKVYPHFFEMVDSAFQLLESIEKHIHVEVLKLYPEAELPSFETELVSPLHLNMIYRSERKMADFAEGLIQKALEHYNEEATITNTALNSDGSEVLFSILKKAE